MANYGKAVWKTQITETWATASDGDPIGSVRYEGNKKYLVIQYNDASVAAVADSMTYYTTALMESFKASCDVSDSYGTSGAKAIACGVLQTVIADGEYGWVQIGGFATITTDAAAGAAGDAVTGVGANDKGVDVSGAATDVVCGIMLTTSTGAQRYFLDCPFNH